MVSIWGLPIDGLAELNGEAFQRFAIHFSLNHEISQTLIPFYSPKDDVLPRLGLLACACSDGTIRIFSIPHPDRIHHMIREQLDKDDFISVCRVSVHEGEESSGAGGGAAIEGNKSVRTKMRLN